MIASTVAISRTITPRYSAVDPYSTYTNTAEPFLRFDGTCGPDPELVRGVWQWFLFILTTLISLVGGALWVIYAAKKKQQKAGPDDTKQSLFRWFLAARIFASAIAKLAAVG